MSLYFQRFLIMNVKLWNYNKIYQKFSYLATAFGWFWHASQLMVSITSCKGQMLYTAAIVESTCSRASLLKPWVQQALISLHHSKTSFSWPPPPAKLVKMPIRVVAIACELLCCTVAAHVFKLSPINDWGLPVYHWGPEAKFLDVIGTKVLGIFLLAIHSHLNYGFYSPLPLGKSVLKLVSNVNIVYGNLNPENSQEYAQKPQRHCTFMNSTSG